MKDYIFIFPMSLPNGRVWKSKDLSDCLTGNISNANLIPSVRSNV